MIQQVKMQDALTNGRTNNNDLYLHSAISKYTLDGSVLVTILYGIY